MATARPRRGPAAPRVVPPSPERSRPTTRSRHIRTAGLALGLGLRLAGAASADFIDTTWVVTGFTGEAVFVDPEALIGRTQSFDAGFADGAFFSCHFGGLSAGYTTYENAAFFTNPEFGLFRPLRDTMGADSATLFVHRVSCAGGDTPHARSQLYPFVTNETRRRAWYLFDGGVFTLRAEQP